MAIAQPGGYALQTPFSKSTLGRGAARCLAVALALSSMVAPSAKAATPIVVPANIPSPGLRQ